MLNGTKNLFPDYENFKEKMIEAAEMEALPVVLKLNSSKNFTLKDFDELFYEFEYDTGLSINGNLFRCPECGELHVVIEIDYPDDEEETLIQ